MAKKKVAKRKASEKKGPKKKAVKKKKPKQSMSREEKAFIKRYYLLEDEYTNSKISIKELGKIETAYNEERDALSAAATPFLETLREIEGVHSLRMRIKGTDRVIKKIIRKQIEDKTLEITLANYEEHIRDKIGIRVLHLYKTDWLNIHKFIIKTWDLWESPFAYIREGDPDVFYEQNGCKTETHKDNYRSVHYLAKTKPMRNEISVEIQVRTLFEEGWSEIDHRIRYPDNVDNTLLNEYLSIFNRLAGSADEMGTFILSLKTYLETQAAIRVELQRKDAELKKAISELSISRAKKKDLENKLEASSGSKLLFDNNSVFEYTHDGSLKLPSMKSKYVSLTDSIINTQICTRCGRRFTCDPLSCSSLCPSCILHPY